MPYVLGIDVGSSRTRAAICRHTATGWSDPVLVSLASPANLTSAAGFGARQPGMPTVLYLAPDRSAVVGDEADRQSQVDPTRIARGFTARMGDDIPLVLGGAPYPAQELTAVLIRWVTDRIAGHEGGPADRVVVTHPAGWGGHRTGLLRHELARQGLLDVSLLAEPLAIAGGYPGPIATGGLLATYALGAATAEAALLRRTEDGGFELLGHRSGSADLAGTAFDDAITDCVRAQVGSALDQLDPTEQQGWLALAGLAGAAIGAKEQLSTQPEVTVPVGLPDQPVDVRITRADFERIIQPVVAAGADLLTRVTATAGDLTAIVLAGGATRIPLVTATIGALSAARVATGADPEATVALGAAATARRLVTGPTAAPVPAAGMGMGAHTEVIERSAIELYGARFDPVAIDEEFGDVPPPRPPVDIPPLDLPERGLVRRVTGRVPPVVMTVSTIVLAAIVVALTFLIEHGSHPNTTNPLHLGPAADQSVQTTSNH